MENITNGIAVGVPLHLKEISDIFQVNEIKFIELVKELKMVGFELRIPIKILNLKQINK